MDYRMKILVLLVVHAVVLISAEETVTENLEIIEDTSTSASVVKSGRSLSVEENTIDAKSKRNPKFGFAIPFPNLPGTGTGPGQEGNSTPGQNQPDTHVFGGFPVDAAGTTATLGTTALLIKGGILSGLTALKAALFPPIFLGALILFLVAGAAFFTCSIVNCGRFIGDIGGPGGAPGFGGFNPFNRNGIEEYDQRPVFQALDEGYKKFSK